MKTTKFFFLIVLGLFLVYCSKDSSDDPQNDPVVQTDDDPVTTTDDDPVVELSSAKDLISFSVTTANNPNLKIDADVQQSGTTLKLFFPFATDLTDLIISFQVSDKATLKIGGADASSGNTIVDFSSDVTITVEAEDGSTQDYSISSESSFEALDAAIEQLMQNNNAPSMQLAITKGEKLVYQAQYGYADLNSTEMVTDDSVYRLASVSKTITMVTILKMRDEGLLNFNDTVFGVNGILGTDFGTPPYKTNIENITVHHLLDHTSGFTNVPNDPFFVNNDWSLQQLIDDVLDNRELATVPGETYYYSNFGYCILGRVVEKLSGMDYEAYVKQNILEPLEITTMNVARNSINEKWPNEVEYFGQETFGPYQYNAERIDALGGWTASATDLAKLMVGIDRRGGVADIITTDAMVDSYLEFAEWTFWGSLPGTSSVIYRLGDDFNFTIVTNTRVLPITLNQDMMDTMRAQVLARNSWPEYDLFDAE